MKTRVMLIGLVFVVAANLPGTDRPANAYLKLGDVPTKAGGEIDVRSDDWHPLESVSFDGSPTPRSDTRAMTAIANPRESRGLAARLRDRPRFPAATLVVRGAGARHMTFKMEKVMVSSYQTGSDVGVETITFTFEKIELEDDAARVKVLSPGGSPR